MAKNRMLLERGRFKAEVTTALYKNADIRELLLGDTTGMSNQEIRTNFKKYVKSHLFIDDTITEKKTFIYYDVSIPSIYTQIKESTVIMYCICSRDILEDYTKEGYCGDRIDILAQMVVDTLVNDTETANNFGIGKLKIDSVEIYNSNRLYGCILSFNVPTFR